MSVLLGQTGDHPVSHERRANPSAGQIQPMSYRTLIFAPVAMTLYQVMTVIAFAFGPWPWPVQNPVALYSYLIAVIVAFCAGAIAAALTPLSWTAPYPQKRETQIVCAAIILMLVSALVMSTARTGSPIPSLPANSLATVEGYARFVERNSIRGWWTYLEYIVAVLCPIFVVALVGAPLYWSRIGLIFKAIYLGSLVIYLMTYFSIGVNRGFFQIVVLLPLTIGLYYLCAKRVSKLTLWIIIGIFVGGSILFSTAFSYLLSYRDTNTLKGYFVVLNLTTDRSGLIFKILPPSFYPAYEIITRYIVHGYYALSLALRETDYNLGYGLTNSMFVLRKAISVLGDQWYGQTLLPLIEKHHGWSAWALWHSAYTWFISDFGVAGSVIFVGLIGGLYGLTWRALLTIGSVLPFAMFYLLNMMAFYFSANNQLFQSADLFVAFFALLILFLIGYRGAFRRMTLRPSS